MQKHTTSGFYIQQLIQLVVEELIMVIRNIAPKL
jgi:hypothetical protein